MSALSTRGHFKKGKLRTLRAAEGCLGSAERPVAAFGDSFVGVPGVIAGEVIVDNGN